MGSRLIQGATVVSRKLLAFLLSDLETVRIRCMNKSCNGIIELKVEHLGTNQSAAKCKVCDTNFAWFGDSANPILLLQNAVRLARDAKARVEIELTFPDESL
jgi:hypothetical protein